MIQLFTTNACDGTLFYVIAVAPEQEYRAYEGTFRADRPVHQAQRLRPSDAAGAGHSASPGI